MEKDFENKQYIFHEFKEENLVFLFDWLCQPYISKWCEKNAELYDMFVQEHKSRLDPKDNSYLVNLSGVPIGYIRYYYTDAIGDGWWGKSKKEVVDTARVIAMIGRPTYLGKGHGSMVIKAFVQELFKTTDIKKIIIGPHHDNTTAIKCYENAGFKPIGEKETPEGPVMVLELNKEAE